MYIGLKHVHSSMAYLVLLILIISVAYALVGFINDNKYTSKSKMLFLIGVSAIHLQFIFGIIIYFVSPLGASNISSETMKSSMARLYALEHPLMMLLGIILITIGYSKAKRVLEDRSKFKLISIFFSLGLLLILARIPWAAWF